MKAVRSMSTRQIVADRKNSKQPAVMSTVARAVGCDVRRRKKPYVAISMAMAARADGRRERNSVTTPPLSHPSSAMHHASIGGL